MESGSLPAEKVGHNKIIVILGPTSSGKSDLAMVSISSSDISLGCEVKNLIQKWPGMAFIFLSKSERVMSLRGVPSTRDDVAIFLLFKRDCFSASWRIAKTSL